MITVKEAAEKWEVTPRRVQMLCKEGKIKGAVRWSRTWMIPDTAILPGSADIIKPDVPMPRKSPFLDMTNIYNKVGMADECAELLVNNPEAYALFKAQIDYRRGNIDAVYEKARYFLSAHSGFYAILGAGMLLAMCATWRGDVNMWHEAKKHIFEVKCNSEREREIVSLTLAVIDSSVYDNKDFPEWFKRGSFLGLPADSHPAAKVFYVKYLYMSAYSVAAKQKKLEGVSGLGLMKFVPHMIEPMISQAVVDGTLIPEMYLRLSCAVAYYNLGERELATTHIDRALDIALADGLFGTLAEYYRHLDRLLEDRIALKDPMALIKVKNLQKDYAAGWTKLSGSVRNINLASNLTPREREIAKLVAFGFSTKKIAKMLYIAESTVKQTVLKIVQKANIKDRSEIAGIL